ncbi:polysaccharide lyase 6 family protein [Sphingomonas cannabina]|uniref:polysaccharide lyase 6 family protein n=1 Tax=Sphingomonas cannabina TaxID=2899123 RepID=UPI001F283372|nr:polysaccharide lyase 6 family protein [Sphingomonas cannabina]UIJ44011.1 polysaccharide lyase 6 family protein [Sphingomonas cannabina]
MKATWLGIAACVMAPPAAARDWVVRDRQGYAEAAARLSPGDRLLLADGEWRDFVIRFTATGTADRPITLAAQTPGKVVLSGRSSLSIAGRHLVVSGLVFRDGHARGESVIELRDGKRWAEHVRLTGIVIDRFNPPRRDRADHWVSLFGSDNRVDHSHFVGKANAGAMMVVVRDTGWPLANRHRIDHNYFGPRPPLGRNGGETIRIGTSTQSQSDSGTIVEDNYFERCDGEAEIVSIKSGGNVVRRNMFVASQGAVVLRHGHGNLVERNIFLGRGVERTGGVRVINARQTVRGNYMEGLAGTGFTSAIAVMNGVPNSPLNRYAPVEDALIANNSVIEAARITLAMGADRERTVAPRSTRFVANLIVNHGDDPFRAEGPIDGIRFEGNVQQAGRRGPLEVGIAPRPVHLEREANGLLYPTDPALAAIGAPRDLAPFDREAVGVDWYPKPATTGTTREES